jgi:hypothetical protein
MEINKSVGVNLGERLGTCPRLCSLKLIRDFDTIPEAVILVNFFQYPHTKQKARIY